MCDHPNNIGTVARKPNSLGIWVVVEFGDRGAHYRPCRSGNHGMVVDHARDRLVRDAGSLRNFTNGRPPHRSPQMRSIDLHDLPLTAIANIAFRGCERSQYTTTG